MYRHRLWNLLILLFEIFLGISASRHWIVTENGQIQAQLVSPFHMRRPYDLLSFLDQEVRHEKINSLHKDLISRKTQINKKWSSLDEATESRLYSHDSECLRAEKPFSNINDLYSKYSNSITNVGTRINIFDYLNYDVPSDASAVPECHKIVDLDFSMFAFEHLVGMVGRNNLTLSPDPSVMQWIIPEGSSVAKFGHKVYLGLLNNATSWLHHNLASMYWRIRGDAYRAIECGRRAVHFAPREYRDIALLNLANIFHLAEQSREAVIIMHAAIDLSPNQVLNHFALGNVYASLSAYNQSITCYNNCLKIKPDFENAIIAKDVVMCLKKLETDLVELNDALQGILRELHDYQTRQDNLLRLQERLIQEQVPFETKLRSLTSDEYKSVISSRGQICKNDDSLLSCKFNNENQIGYDLQMDITLSLLHNVELQVHKISEKMAKNINKDYFNKIKDIDLLAVDLKEEENEIEIVDEMKFEEFNNIPTEQSKYPANMVLSWNSEYDAPNWPTKKQCRSWKITIDSKKVFGVFLPPENKGFHITSMLTDLIDLPAEVEHALPWYPPLCVLNGTDAEVDKYFPTAIYKKNYLGEPDPQLRVHLLQYVNQEKSEEAEVGQRILTAMQKKVGPQWLLATLSSLYWRVRSNHRNAFDCLKVALSNVPFDYRDTVLISVAALLYEHNFLNEALTVATDAYNINRIEPATNFLLALIHNLKLNTFGAIYHLKRTVRVESDFKNGDADILLKKWVCDTKLGKKVVETTENNNKKEQCPEKGEVVSAICSAIKDDINTLKELNSIKEQIRELCVRTEDVVSTFCTATKGEHQNLKSKICEQAESEETIGAICSALKEEHTIGGLHLTDLDLIKEHLREECTENKETISVLCSTNPEKDHSAAIQCFKAEKISEQGDIVTIQSTHLKILEDGECGMNKIGLGKSIISSLIAANLRNEGNAEGSGNVEPDQSQLETLNDAL